MYSYLDEERDIVLSWVELSPQYLFFPLELQEIVTSVLYLRNISQDKSSISFQIDLPFPLSMILELEPSSIGVIPFGDVRELQCFCSIFFVDNIVILYCSDDKTYKIIQVKLDFGSTSELSKVEPRIAKFGLHATHSFNFWIARRKRFKCSTRSSKRKAIYGSI